MRISGIQKFTVLDYPNKTACIVFTPGCNFRCGFCHNPEFVLPELIQKIKDSFIPENVFFNFLEKRKGLLDGVVITGGEPTIHGDLLSFIRKIKSMGFLVKLDTNGTKPELIASLIREKAIDYIAMDFKTDWEHYAELVGVDIDVDALKQSVYTIKKGGIPYEFRCTVIKELHTFHVLSSMALTLKGASQFFLQSYRPGKVLKSSFSGFHSYSLQELDRIAAEIFEPIIQKVEVRHS